jgi:Superfamily I DNA and RNA helicases
MDLSTAIKLADSDVKIDIEVPFKLCAGPGAGKTRFLINHINNILSNSKRLSKVRKIACITYTNVGVETIIGRLENIIDYVDVSTIHSFLYKNILKPYLWVLKDEFSFPFEQIDGHDDVMPSYSILKEWKERSAQQRIRDDKKLAKALMKLRWEFQDDGNIELRFKYVSDGKIDGYNLKKESYLTYKKICWEKGLISHDDVLFLSYEILCKQPRILEFLRAKFPYILVDEFQDTSPIQSKIITMIAAKEVIVGVIGDVCQSIYKFQGADVQKFISFTLPGMKLLMIENNHRSTKQIIDVLNDVRNEAEFIQNSPKNKQGSKPVILVGSFFEAYKQANQLCNCQPICTLTFRNDMSNIMKYGFEDYFSDDVSNELIFSDGDRGKMIFFVITALEYCRQNKIKDALKFVRKAYRKDAEFDDKKALLNIKRLICDYDKFGDLCIKDFYNNYLFNFNGTKGKISSGKASEYYTKLKYSKVAVAINIADDNSKNRTIHKAKGDQFDNVLLILQPKENYDENEELGFLLNSDMSKEEHRVYYVALSRARNKLFINVPQLSQENISKLSKFDLIHLTPC